MARVLIIGILAFLLLQLAAGQVPSTACQNAVNTLAANTASCTPTVENPQIFCTGDCRQYYDDVIDNCDEAVSQVAIMCEISCLCACLVINYISIVSLILLLDLYIR